LSEYRKGEVLWCFNGIASWIKKDLSIPKIHGSGRKIGLGILDTWSWDIVFLSFQDTGHAVADGFSSTPVHHTQTRMI